MPPHLLSNTYALHESLGEGGMGIVYRATNRLTRQIVALKQLRAKRRPGPSPDPEMTVTSDPLAKLASLGLDSRVALVREFQTLSSLHHPNVIRVFDYGFDETCGPYFTMEMLSAPRNIRVACAEASVEDKLDPLVQLLRGLVYVHRRNIIHCDLKPSNVLLVDGQVKILDFGIAYTDSAEPRAAGTIGYVAPEVLLGGAPTVASDLFSFGVLAYQLFAGRFPYDMSSASSFLRGLLHRTVSHLDFDVTMVAMAYLTLGEKVDGNDGPRGPLPLEGLGRLTEPLNRVIMRLLAPEADQRYPSAEAVIDDLGSALDMRVFVDTADTRESFLKSAEFVGRDEELATLLGALESAARGQGSGWLVGGESGVGKSRLVEELRTLALVQSAQVVRTRATLEHARPYQLWAPLVRALAVYVGVDDDEACVLKDIVPDIGSLLERPVRDASRVSPGVARERLFGVVLGVLRRHLRPLVVVLEDLQWADGDSLTLLDFLSATFGELPLLVVANYRDDERPDLPSAVPTLKTIALKRLPPEVIGRVVASMLGADSASADLIEFLQKETEGNAFFLVEALRALAEETPRLADVTKIDLPERIVTGGMARVIQRRLDRLPKNLLPLLQIAAVAGRRIDREVLEVAAPGQDVGAWLMISANAAILETQDGLWQFTHDKLRERALSELAADETRSLHRRVAEALNTVHGDSSEKQPILAYHYKHADMPLEAARCFEASASESARLGAVVDARRYYAAALEELSRIPDTEELRRRRVDVAVQQATISWYSVPPGDTLAMMAEAETWLESIERSRWSPLDHGRAASVCLFRGRGIYALSRTAEALTSYRTGLEHVTKSGDASAEILLKVSAGQSLMILGHFKDSLPYLEEAVGMLANAGNWLEWSRVAGFLGMTLAAMGDLDGAFDVLESSARRTRELKSSTYLALLHIYPTVVNLWIENWPDMLHEGRECARIAIEGKDLGVACLGLSMWEWAAIRMGDRATADSARQQLSAIHERLGGSTLDDWYAVAGIDRALAFGTPDEAAAIAERTVARSKEKGSIVGEALANRSWARALGRMDRYDEAEEHLAASLRVSDEAGASMLTARTYLGWADLCRAKGDARRADRYTDLALYAAESPAARLLGSNAVLMEPERRGTGPDSP